MDDLENALKHTLIGLITASWWGPLLPLAVAVWGLRALAGDPAVKQFDVSSFVLVWTGLAVWTAVLCTALDAAGVIAL